MTSIESSQTPMAKAVLCHHGYPVVHRISRKSYSYGRSFSCCPIHWEDPNHCSFFGWDHPIPPPDEPRAQVPVKQYQTTAEYMSASPTASASPRQVKYGFITSRSAEKCPATSSAEDVLQVSSSSRSGACTGPDSPSREYSLPVYVRELKRQVSNLQESNEMMESRILQLERQLWENEKRRGLD